LKTKAKVSSKTLQCVAVQAGAAKAFKPGNRVVARPQWDKDRCVRCGICYIYCPHGAVVRQDDGFFDANTDRCSGCGVCHRECWFGVIGMVEEA